LANSLIEADHMAHESATKPGHANKAIEGLVARLPLHRDCAGAENKSRANPKDDAALI
jgi:hypothetical protein